MPGTARGTLPCLMCKSLVQMLPSVTRTIASRESFSSGFGLSDSSNLPCSMYVYASIVSSSIISSCFWGEYKHYIPDKRTIIENIYRHLTPVRIRMVTFADRYQNPHITTIHNEQKRTYIFRYSQ